ncbi:MAG TPA: hypothetical protein PLO61_02770 [Fimbriimonadaceae bacterium]|nr:hypothetical protein [Fimbriimonadaceae bacterium]HRJ32031.1 hypothetical protein [Fimbriimonadaceae bacterium]
MPRILVYGVTGSGKSTLAAEISRRLGLAWTSVDDLTFLPNWVPVPEAEQRELITRICAEPDWILDTAYGMWLDIPLARVTLIVALDYPRWLSFGRLLRRTVHRVVSRTPVCNGNTESLRLVLSRQSILAWHFRSFARKRSRIRGWAVDPVLQDRVIVLRSLRETRAWLRTLGSG